MRFCCKSSGGARARVLPGVYPYRHGAPAFALAQSFTTLRSILSVRASRVEPADDTDRHGRPRRVGDC